MKICSGCKRHLRVVIPSSDKPAFNRKLGTDDGLQPFCRTCDWNGKATLDEAWNRFSRVLRDEPASAPLWTRQMYFDVLGADPACNWCGSSCREWGIGHWIDRQSSDYGHIPSNCVVCCTPCNMHKGHKPYGVYEATLLRSLLKSCSEFPHGTGRHPWGKVPWDLYPSSSKHFQRVMPPDLSAHVVKSNQLDMFGLQVVA